MPDRAVDAFANRLKKSARHFHKWARARDLTAYRLYDRDIPGFAYAVDWYDGRVQLAEYARGSREGNRADVLAAVIEVLEVPAERVFLKTREPKVWGREQYQRLGDAPAVFEVREQGLTFRVDLASHLDTGLFLDHRLTRARVRDEARGKRVLNLFAYTGAFTVYAAAGGAAATTSVDLSKTYLDWLEENLSLNHLSGPRQARVRADARQWLAEASAASFDLIVLDPPSFSTSKAMAGTLDVQRDHPALIRDALRVLAPGGVLYFSTNLRGFTLDDRLEGHFAELTPRSIPEDFQRKDVHRCWRVTA
jgi:23S rRNA (cytosine1962-C5)-methyltransferase